MITTQLKKFIRNPLIREGSTLLSLYWLYSSIRWFVARNSPYEAFSNAYKIIRLETSLGIFHEPAIQKWLIEHAMGLVRLANNFYTVGYFPLLILTGVWLYFHNHERFYVFKLTFALGLGFALVCFSLFPLAPPRMLSEAGFIDTQQIYGDGFYNKQSFVSFYNPYAAMPSLHFGWSLLISIMAYLSGRRLLKLMGFLYPLSMAFTIITTGHHYILDVVGGGVVVSSAYLLVNALPRSTREWVANPARANSDGSLEQSAKPRSLVQRTDLPVSSHVPDRLERAKAQALYYINHLAK
jgi:membrane-associated phospholipid phosphatase